MFLRFSQTASPTFNTCAWSLVLLELSSILCWADAIAAWANSWAARSLSTNFSAAFAGGLAFVIGSNCWIGSMLYWWVKKNGLAPNAVSLLLIASIAVGRSSTQLYCA